MPTPKILLVWSNYYKELGEKQLASCIERLDQSNYDYKIETVSAGTYELPSVIQHYHQHDPYDGYIPLGLLLKGSTDHYEFILEHVKACFIQFALRGLSIGNGIISASSMELLTSRVENHERVHEAINAVDYLIQLKKRMLVV